MTAKRVLRYNDRGYGNRFRWRLGVFSSRRGLSALFATQTKRDGTRMGIKKRYDDADHDWSKCLSTNIPRSELIRSNGSWIIPSSASSPSLEALHYSYTSSKGVYRGTPESREAMKVQDGGEVQSAGRAWWRKDVMGTAIGSIKLWDGCILSCSRECFVIAE